VVAVVTSFVAGPFMALLYGPAYAGSGVALAVLVWCGVFASLSFASGRWYLLEGLQKLALSRNLFGVVVNVAMNFVLIPRYGALGAAFSTLSAQCCAALLFDVFGQRTRDAFFMKLKALLMIGLLRRLFVR
jgi:polysaccharide transporter, PST family